MAPLLGFAHPPPNSRGRSCGRARFVLPEDDKVERERRREYEFRAGRGAQIIPRGINLLESYISRGGFKANSAFCSLRSHRYFGWRSERGRKRGSWAVQEMC